MISSDVLQIYDSKTAYWGKYQIKKRYIQSLSGKNLLLKFGLDIY